MCSLRMNCGVLLARVFALRFLRGYLRFARGVNVNDRQLAVNASQWFLACFARYGRQCFLCGVWRQCSLMVLPQLAVGMGVNAACFARCGSVRGYSSYVGAAACLGLCFLRGFLRFARGLNVNDRQLAVNASQWFFGLALLAMVVNAFFVGYGANAR